MSARAGTGKRLTLSEIQEQIFQREGFRVSFVPLGHSNHALPPYDHPLMAPNTWHVSDWRRIRLVPYIVSFADVFVYGGDGKPIAGDVKLGHLRDTYFAARYGTLTPDTRASAPSTAASRLLRYDR
jgi:hypothetical protein